MVAGFIREITDEMPAAVGVVVDVQLRGHGREVADVEVVTEIDGGLIDRREEVTVVVRQRVVVGRMQETRPAEAVVLVECELYPGVLVDAGVGLARRTE